MHRHRAATTETKPFSACIAHPCNPASHGGVCEIEHCKCGAWRARNRNGVEEERGLWEVPAQRGPGRPRLDSSIVAVRMRPETYLQLVDAARVDGLLPSTWVRRLVERTIEERQNAEGQTPKDLA